MANTFNEFFTNVGPNLDNEIPKNPRNPTIYLKNRILDSFSTAPRDHKSPGLRSLKNADYAR